MKNFGLIGVGGFVAPRHLRAINDTGNRLIAACDPFDSVGVMDQFSPDAHFFTEFERFDRFLEKRRRLSEEERVHVMSICTPNYLHDAHIRCALRIGADAICEKPLVINPWNLDQLQRLEEEYDGTVYTVLQLRLMESLIELKKEIDASDKRYNVDLTYITRRGRWYHTSWKGVEEKSGGLIMNIGIHFFDLLLWLFGGASNVSVQEKEAMRVRGKMSLKRADVTWHLSIDATDLPQRIKDEGGYAFRSMTVDDREIEFSTGFTHLHTELYRQTMAGDGFTLADARPSIELAYKIRTANPTK